jgi:hypothetical protein
MIEGHSRGALIPIRWTWTSDAGERCPAQPLRRAPSQLVASLCPAHFPPIFWEDSPHARPVRNGRLCDRRRAGSGTPAHEPAQGTHDRGGNGRQWYEGPRPPSRSAPLLLDRRPTTPRHESHPGVLCGETPLIPQREIQATVALGGGVVRFLQQRAPLRSRR